MEDITVQRKLVETLRAKLMDGPKGEERYAEYKRQFARLTEMETQHEPSTDERVLCGDRAV